MAYSMYLRMSQLLTSTLKKKALTTIHQAKHSNKNQGSSLIYFCFISWWCRLHLHLRYDHSCGFPSQGEGKKITMPPHRGILHHPTKFFPSLAHNAHCGIGKMRWRIQAGDTLHRHHLYPRDHRTLCPIARGSKLQHGHNNNHHLPTEG